MSPDQAEALVARIVATWRGRLSAEARAVWAKALADLDHNQASSAVDRLAGTEAHMPSVAQIILTAATLGQPGISGTGWQVTSHWTDTKGCAWATDTWHPTLEAAQAAYARLVADRGDHLKTVELHEHPDGLPGRLIQQATV